MAIVPEQKIGVVLLLNADPYGLPIVLEEVGMGVTALLAGQQPDPIKLDFHPVDHAPHAADPASPDRRRPRHPAAATRSWRQDPQRRSSRGRTWGQHILLPLIPNLTLAAILVYLQSSRLIRFLHLFMPDLAWIAQISGIFAGIWAVLRTGLILQTIRKPTSPQTLVGKLRDEPKSVL